MNNKGFERIAFLAEKFKVFTAEEYTQMAENDVFISQADNQILGTQYRAEGKVRPILIEFDGLVVGYYIIDHIDYDGAKVIKEVRLHEDVLTDMVQHDPTKNKAYVQWMLTTFVRYVKGDEFDEAYRFITEDLTQCTEYLKLFEENKNRKMFKKLCKNNPSLSGIKDVSNINQYVNLSQVFDAVEFYIERDISGLEAKMLQHVKVGDAEIPFKDRNFTLYIPKTIAASVIFNDFASWCTAKSENSNFASYTKQKTSLGEDSRLYIVINNNFFLDKSHPEYEDEMYQFHFESGQKMDRSNSTSNQIKAKVIDRSNGIKNYFEDLLITLGRAERSNLTHKGSGNKYLTHLLDFGFLDAIFKIIPEDSNGIKYINKDIPKLPDMRIFTRLAFLYLNNVGLKTIDESVGDLSDLAVLALPNNKLTSIPKSICYMKRLTIINLNKNNIKELPEEITNLDISNGGRLIRLVVSDNGMSNSYLEKLQKLLPQTKIVSVNEED